MDVVFPADLTLRFYKYSPTRYKNLITAKAVLDNVKRIFWGVREFQQGGYCYAGRPATWYVKEDVEASFPSDLVYVVYLNPRMFIYEIRAENAATDDPLCPIDWPNRFRGLRWKSTS